MFYSKNPNSSCLSTKHAIARRMMTAQVIQRNIYSSFPLIASLEMSSICIIFLVLERRDCMCALSCVFRSPSWLGDFRWSTSILKFHSLVDMCIQIFFKTLKRLPIRIISILSHRLAISKERVNRMSGKSCLTFYFTPVYLHRHATYYEENRVFWWHFLGSINCT